ncbi:MAG TPA: bifunctional phosphoglucose/phosphomannose isomerase [Thermoleophilaceae bacterium]|nr:bifunctional phosphoglucose/phosphomannose isomerase [Thermoleophilaceae bacterium]
MLDDVLAQPEQVEDALWRTEAAGIERRPLEGGLVVAGMGGSAIGGDLAHAIVGDRATRPIRTRRGYWLDPWTRPDALVLCASYSGETEETLACYDAARELGAPRVVLTTGGTLAERARRDGVPVIGVPGGMQPRAAVVYMTVAALECAAACGAAPSLRDEVEAAAATLEAIASSSLPEDLAGELIDRVPIVHGAGRTAAPARRWKTQLNENSEVPAFHTVLPEGDHNEVCGYGTGLAPFAAILLTDDALDPRLKRRIGITAEILAEEGTPVHTVEARGETPAERVLSLVMLGDLTSVHLAYARGVDPTPVEAIDRLKARLAEEP